MAAVDEDQVFLSVAAFAEIRRGILMARSQALGTNLRTLDAFFAATALAKGLILVTRNVKDFAGLGLLLFNPWEPDAPAT